jgi:hypothetical protein
MIFKTCEVLITNFIKSSNPIFDVYYILQYLYLDVRRDLVQNIHGTVIYVYLLLWICAQPDDGFYRRKMLCLDLIRIILLFVYNILHLHTVVIMCII